MTRAQAYSRLAVLALALAAIVLILRRELLPAVVLPLIVAGTGALAIELGLSRRRPPPPHDDEESSP